MIIISYIVLFPFNLVNLIDPELVERDEEDDENENDQENIVTKHD